MAHDPRARFMASPAAFGRRALALRDDARFRIGPRFVDPGATIDPGFATLPPETVFPEVPPEEQLTQPPPPAAPAPAPPQAPAADPFAELPFPNAGDRIKAEDFRKLAQGLRVLADAYALAGAAFGQPFGQVRTALRGQGYEIARVVSVHGAELAGPDDPSLDDRKVVHVAPLALGQPRVGVVVADVGEARAERRMPNLVGLTYRQAAARMQAELGDVLGQLGPVTVPNLVGRTFSDAERAVGG